MMTRPCAVCGAQVAVRKSKGGRAYTMCNASDDAQACGSRVVYGARHSRELLASAAPGPAAPTAPRRQPAATRAAKASTAGPLRQPPKPARAPEAPTAPQAADDGFGSLSDW